MKIFSFFSRYLGTKEESSVVSNNSASDTQEVLENEDKDKSLSKEDQAIGLESSYCDSDRMLEYVENEPEDNDEYLFDDDESLSLNLQFHSVDSISVSGILKFRS